MSTCLTQDLDDTDGNFVELYESESEEDEQTNNFDSCDLSVEVEFEDTIEDLDIATEVEISSQRVTDYASHGCVIVMDNIDKNIRPSFQRLYNNTRSLHYSNTFAVWDRIPLQEYEMCTAASGYTTIDVSSLLPSIDDITTIKSEFEILVSRYS